MYFGVRVDRVPAGGCAAHPVVCGWVFVDEPVVCGWEAQTCLHDAHHVRERRSPTFPLGEQLLTGLLTKAILLGARHLWQVREVLEENHQN